MPHESPLRFPQSQRRQTNTGEVNEAVCKHARAGADTPESERPEGRKPVPRAGSASAPAAGGPGSSPTLSKQSGGQGAPLYRPPLSSRALSGRGWRLLCCSSANSVHKNTPDQAAHTTSPDAARACLRSLFKQRSLSGHFFFSLSYRARVQKIQNLGREWDGGRGESRGKIPSLPENGSEKGFITEQKNRRLKIAINRKAKMVLLNRGSLVFLVA